MATNFNISTIAEMYRETALAYRDTPAYGTRDIAKKFNSVTFGEIYEMGLALSTALIDLGLRARDHVVIFSDNRFEWILSDYGILLSGAADVPRGSDVTDADISYIVPHSGAKIIFVENDAVYKKVKKNKSKLRNLRHIIMMDRETKAPGGVLHLYDLLESGKKLRDSGDRRAEARIRGIKPDDLFTLIYTSGTTGIPKGVMLTHANMVSQVKLLPITIKHGDRFLSILPIWHILERIFAMIANYNGATTYYTNIRTLKEDMSIVKPTIMGSAPRLWESIYNGIQKNIKSAPPVKKKLFAAAYFCANHFKEGYNFLTFQKMDLTGRNLFVSIVTGIVSILKVFVFIIPYLFLDLIVLKKIRKAMGGELRLTISGGGALPLHVDHFFNNIGVKILEGYGLTETCPVLAVRTEKTNVIGTVGPIWPQTEIRLVDIATGSIIYPPECGVMGEIHAKGPQVMKGYYKNKKVTDSVMREGWFNTGDLGIITHNNCLKIVGRSKETIVLMGGENVEPTPLETRILALPEVEQCMVVGQDQKYLSVLVVPSADFFKNYGRDVAEISRQSDVQKKILEAIKSQISAEHGFKPYERIIDCRLLPKAFEVGDELTASYKVKRHLVSEKYKKVINSMY